MLTQELKSQINKLWDKFWSGGISNPLSAIEQMSYLIFMKRIEDLDNRNKSLAEARKEKYESASGSYSNLFSPIFGNTSGLRIDLTFFSTAFLMNSFGLMSSFSQMTFIAA